MTRRELITTTTTYNNCSLPSGTSRVHTHIHIYIRALFFFFVFSSLYKQQNSQHLHHNLIVLFLICVHAVMEQMCGAILLGLFSTTSSGQWVTRSALASITWITRITKPDIPKNLHIGSTICSRTRKVVCCKTLVGIVLRLLSLKNVFCTVVYLI